MQTENKDIKGMEEYLSEKNINEAEKIKVGDRVQLKDGRKGNVSKTEKKVLDAGRIFVLTDDHEERTYLIKDLKKIK